MASEDPSALDPHPPADEERQERVSARVPTEVRDHPILDRAKEQGGLSTLVNQALRREINRRVEGEGASPATVDMDRRDREARLRVLVEKQVAAREAAPRSDWAWSQFLDNSLAQQVGKARSRAIIEDVLGRKVRWYK